ncbi:MAG: thioredoxin family protein [Deltaproteobacteria bacterium]|nr:thioredoxin family protein [Deltaproteobacteria bacterium]
MDEQLLKAFLESRPQDLALKFYPRGEDPRSALLETFLLRMNREVGIPWVLGETAGLGNLELPAFSLGNQGAFRHFYQAVPEGLEWPPFLTLVKILAGEKPALHPGTLAVLENFQAPLTITVLITPSCPFCPRMVELAHKLAAAGANIRTRVVDILLFPEWAERYQPRAAPTTVLGEEVFLTGMHSETELAEWLVRISSEDFLLSLYRNDLLEKRLDEAVERLRLHPENLPLAARLLEAEEFGIKLGAMALFEELIDAESDLQGGILEALAPLLTGSPDQVTGDAAFLISRVRDPRKKALLQGLQNHHNPEIAEIAREGLSGEETNQTSNIEF